MIKSLQEKFYKKVGRCLTNERKRRNMTIPHLANLSGEQIKTIQSIEEGRGLYMHHAIWMKNLMGMDFNKIIEDMEGINHEQEIEDTTARITTEERKAIESFIDFIGRQHQAGAETIGGFTHVDDLI